MIAQRKKSFQYNSLTDRVAKSNSFLKLTFTEISLLVDCSRLHLPDTEQLWWYDKTFLMKYLPSSRWIISEAVIGEFDRLNDRFHLRRSAGLQFEIRYHYWLEQMVQDAATNE